MSWSSPRRWCPCRPLCGSRCPPSTRIIDLTLRLGDSAATSGAARPLSIDPAAGRCRLRWPRPCCCCSCARARSSRAEACAGACARSPGLGLVLAAVGIGAARHRATAALLDVSDAVGDAVRAVHEPQRLRDLARDGAAADGRLPDRAAAIAPNARPSAGRRRGIRQHGDVAHDGGRPDGRGSRRRTVAIGLDRRRRRDSARSGCCRPRGCSGRGQAWLLAGFGAIALVAAAYANTNAISTRVDETIRLGLGGRSAIWRETLPMISDFWLTGVGPGAYERGMIVYQQSPRRRLLQPRAQRIPSDRRRGRTAACGAGARHCRRRRVANSPEPRRRPDADLLGAGGRGRRPRGGRRAELVGNRLTCARQRAVVRRRRGDRDARSRGARQSEVVRTFRSACSGQAGRPALRLSPVKPRVDRFHAS